METTLQEIQRFLDAEGFVTVFEAAGDAESLDRLLVAKDEEADPALELLFVPAEEELEDVRLLQFFTALPIAADGAARGELKQLIDHLNVIIPLIGFELRDDVDRLCYRYVLVVPATSPAPGQPVVTETVWLIYYLIDRFLPVLQAVAGGEKTAAEVLA